ncbi:nucleoid-associated protein [Clostridium botulinum]|nr:nucleoid-associated protein [Clostridium botulinum]NFI17067.1 nucleoid-associated protein [Clostridium botulinum]NFL92001.1 nucleoid-associated protein [Clostridium botulinum]NFN51268.1 nucleoid-associated protein [Clostridium botulinum]NFO26477.1 nucleoid-associated protein [Clostridium botulinum]
MITNVKNITITKSILHIINGTSSHFNNVLLPTTDNDFNSFLIRHIRSGIRTKARKSAIFNNKEINNTYKYIIDMFNTDNDFIENSQLLANSLKGICITKNRGPYDLVFCEYINEDDEKYIAIILLEFATSFFHEIIESDALIKHLTVLASSTSNFKKCVLIPNNSDCYDYDFIINDKHIADFFLKDFLKSKLYMDDRKATETFIEQTISWVNEKYDNQSYDIIIKNKLEEVKSECIALINRVDTIDIDAFEDNIFRDDISGFKDDYNLHLERHGLIVKEICLTNDVTSDYKYQKIKLDNNSEIKIPVALIDNDDYTTEYNRCIKEDGYTEFTLKGKILSEKVKSR